VAGVSEEIVFRWSLMSYFAAYWEAANAENLSAKVHVISRR